MALVRKKIKDYERWILIAVVVVILATISVTSVGPTSCGRPPGAGDFSGSFLVAPGERVSVSSDEFQAVLHRYAPFYQRVGTPSLRYAAFFQQQQAKPLPPEQATWMHLATVGAAKAAGYRVGDDELRDGIRAFVGEYVRGSSRSMRGDPTLLYTPEAYDRLVQEVYGGTKADFEQTFREVMLKDKFVAPLVDSARFSKSYDEAFDAWKSQRERVDLAFVAVPSDQFLDRATALEATRSEVAAQAETLRRVVASAQRVRGLRAFLDDTWKKKHDTYPKDAAELVAGRDGKDPRRDPLDEDSWKKPLVYELRDGVPHVASVGPDGTAGTPDDVTITVADTVATLASLRQVADALLQWRNATKELPASLDALKTAPPSTTGARTVPPLNEVPNDAWGKPLVYEREGPVLLSTGADGQRGTPDDLRAEVGADGATLPAPSTLSPWVAAKPDAWGRPLDVWFHTANPWQFRVESAGPDGKPGTDDDVKTGNAEDVLAFFNSPKERTEHRVPQRHAFEAVWVHFPLVPDEVFQKLWEKFPMYRPKEVGPKEDEAFARFKNLEGTYYQVYETGPDGRRVLDAEGKPKELDPADPEKGHGSALFEKGERDEKDPKPAKTWFVPAASAFVDLKDVAPYPDDPLHKTYLERGWRRILLREQFFEALLNDWLTRARESQSKHEAWERDGKKGEEPVVETFSTLLASVSDLQPGVADRDQGARFLEYLKKAEPVTMKEWEALPGIGDLQTTIALGRLSKDGEYAALPTVVKNSLGRTILRNLKFEPESDRTLEDPGVREALWPRYLQARAMTLAEAELAKVRDAATPAPGAGADTTPKPIGEVAAEVAKERGFRFFTGSTGLFVGNGDAKPALRVPPTASAEEKAALQRAHFVRSEGYPRVRAAGAGSDTPVAVGAVARTTLRDDDRPDATKEAFLVQVKAREDAPREEFHGGEYREWLVRQAYAFDRRSGSPLREDEGFMTRSLSRFFDDFDEFKSVFVLQTARPLSQPRPAPAAPRRT